MHERCQKQQQKQKAAALPLRVKQVHLHLLNRQSISRNTSRLSLDRWSDRLAKLAKQELQEPLEALALAAFQPQSQSKKNLRCRLRKKRLRLRPLLRLCSTLCSLCKHVRQPRESLRQIGILARALINHDLADSEDGNNSTFTEKLNCSACLELKHQTERKP